jgi:hypothetical protein
VVTGEQVAQWLDGYEAEVIAPLFRIGSNPNQQKLLNRRSDVEFLRHYNDAGTRAAFEKSRKMSWHGLPIMREQNQRQWQERADQVNR